jgi:hypothetical protein
MCRDSGPGVDRARRGRRLSLGCLLTAFALGLALVPGAGANHSITELVSGSSNTADTWFSGIYGSRIFLYTGEKYSPEDTDGLCPGFDPEWDPPHPCFDAYAKVGNSYTLISTGTTGGSGDYEAGLIGASPDGSRAYFSTRERMIAEDTDDSPDIYERSGGSTSLVTVGPTGGNGSSYYWDGGLVSDDGTRVLFRTNESLVASDTDTMYDIYERSNGVTTLISTGPLDSGTAWAESLTRASSDGTRVFFISRAPLVSGDTDAVGDIYMREGGTTTLVTPGTNTWINDTEFQVSRDGSAVLFVTAEPVTPDDLDTQLDAYKWRNGTITLESTGPTDSASWSLCADFDCWRRISADGRRSFFYTHESLTSEDTGGYLDLYERTDETTTRLVSIGPEGGNGPIHTRHRFFVSADGTHVFFWTPESLVSADGDTSVDLYDRSGGTTALVSTGPTDVPNSIHDWTSYTPPMISEDGSRIVFPSYARLVAEDDDGSGGRLDMYERHAATTTLLSPGPPNDSYDDYFAWGGTRDLSQIFLTTRLHLHGDDSDGEYFDVFRKTLYATPQSASPLRVSIVPNYRQCGTAARPANGQHSPPLATGACNPPSPVSNIARFGAESEGAAELTVVPGNPDTAADEADVTIVANVFDVRTPAGGEYAPNPTGPDLQFAARIRVTDSRNCAGSGCAGPYTEAATAAEFDLAAPAECIGTASPTTGSACAVSTSADALLPGFAQESRSTLIQAFRVRVDDAGANGIVGDADDRLFAQQGIYVP